MNYDQARIRSASRKRRRKLDRWLNENRNKQSRLKIGGMEVEYDWLSQYPTDTDLKNAKANLE